MHEFLTVKEVAELLRIKERKLYDLSAEGVLPVTKVTGKLIFPRDALMAWLRQNTDYGASLPSLKEHPAVMAGSHDPLLDWALRASGSELATYYDGSTDGLNRIKAGQAVAAGIHFGDGSGNGNVGWVRGELMHEPVVLVEWARRMQGLIVRPDCAGQIAGVTDLAGRRIVFRQPGAGSQFLFSALLEQAGLGEGDFDVLPQVARSESDLAEAIAQGEADAGFGVEAVARQHKLAFVPLEQERFDLLVWRRDYCEPPIQRLMAFARTPAFAERAEHLRGYDINQCGTIRFNGP